MTLDDSWLRQKNAYPSLITMPVRYGDIDMNHHVNNAIYASYFEDGRTHLLAEGARGVAMAESGWVLARIMINFLAEIRYPATVTIATGIGRIGSSSILHYQAVFDGETCAAQGEATVVQIDPSSRKSLPLTLNQRQSAERMMMRPHGG